MGRKAQVRLPPYGADKRSVEVIQGALKRLKERKKSQKSIARELEILIGLKEAPRDALALPRCDRSADRE